MKVKRRIVIVLAAALAIIIMTAMGVYAADYEVLETDVSTPSSGCVMLGVYGSYHSDAQAALDRINEIRHEACYDGKTPDPRNSSRMLSPTDYVPMKWSTSLEKIARIRAVEGGIARGHVRHNGKSWSSISYGGISTSAENLAYNNSSSMVYSVNAWYEERNDWVEGNEGENIVTGHYESLINPSYTYVGLGLFESDAGPRPCNCAGEFSSSAGNLGTTFLNAPKNVMQKIEVKEDYIDDYYINQRAELNLTGQQKLEFRVKDTVPGGKSSSKLWVIDPITWSSSNSGIVSVASDGTATGKGLGTATVTARTSSKTASLSITVTCKHNYEFGEPDASGKCKGTCTICGDTINIVPPTQFTAFWRNDKTSTSTSYSSRLPSDNPNGSNVGIMIDYINGDAGYQDMVVETSDPVGAPVTETYYGFSIGVQTAGLVDVHIYPKYNPAAGKTYTLRFGDEGSANIGDAEATLGTLEYTYNGSAIKPSVSVTYNGKPLNTSDDYTVSYEDNINAGTAKAIVTGKGIWSGTITKEFTINPADISGSARVTLSPTSYVCDGTPKEPSVTVTYSSKTLTKGTDYDVEYTNNIYLGKATATVTGKGNYTGSKSADFQMTHTNHDYSETIHKAPTCTEEGSATYTCTVCRYSYDKTLPATGIHTPVTDAKVDPTCTKTGLTEGSHCSVCGNVLTEQTIIPALGHTPGKPVHENEVAASCTKGGSYDEVVYCSVCKDEVSRDSKTTEALGHDYQDIPGTAVAPSCTEPGKEANKKCSRCNDILTGKDIAPLGHTPAQPVHENEVAASCTEGGSYEEVVYCVVCKDELTRDTKSVKPLGHDYQNVPGTAVDPSCTKPGKEANKKCSRCNDILTGKDIAALGHTPGKPVHENEVAASCTEDGSYEEVVYCSTCNVELSREPKTAEATGHSWGEWTVTQAATTSSTGLKERKCKNCDATEQEEIAKVAPAPAAPTVPPVITGDISPENPVSAAAVEKQLTTAMNDSDPKGSSFGLLQAKGVSKSKKSVTVSWKRIGGAKTYIVYGNKCGKGNPYRKLMEVNGTSFTQQGLKKGTYYKYIVVAVDGDKALASSKTIHVATKGGKVGNDKSIKVAKSVLKKAKSLKKGKTLKLKAKAVKASGMKVKKHRVITYESSNPKVATVSKKGVVKATAKGTCYIYAYAQDGVSKKIKVNVK